MLGALPGPTAMNFFCRILGHTWVPASETPKIAWNIDKKGQTLVPTTEGEPVFFRECRRCGTRREVPRRRFDPEPAPEAAAEAPAPQA